MRSQFTDAALSRAAKTLGTDLPTVKAVAKVESAGSGFLADGRPKILFERHIFSRLTGRAHDATNPDLSSSKAGGYLGGELEYPRLYRALQLDGDAAVQSASWGGFQIMGFNWRECGERSLAGFLIAMHHNADAHLALFVQFVLGRDLAPLLRDHKWASFAEKYNGPSYRINNYDGRLAAAYAAAKGTP